MHHGLAPDLDAGGPHQAGIEGLHRRLLKIPWWMIDPSADQPSSSKGVQVVALDEEMLEGAFPVGRQMAFEPDVLEACHQMRLRVACVAGGDRPLPLEVGCAFVSEAEIWKHYEEINKGFYIHNDDE